MIYQGSKARLIKDIKPFIQNCIDENKIELYLEPFVGGANVIMHIDCKNRVGVDNNDDLIALLCHVQKHPELKDFPETCNFEHYAKVRESRKLGNHDFPLWYKAGIGYFASYGGRYFDGGYGRDSKGGRCIYAERLAKVRKEAPLLHDCTFMSSSFENIGIIQKAMMYCDPPYKGTKTYNSKVFDYEKFYEWLREVSMTNYVLVSEYNMPEDFVCIWSKERKILQKSDREHADIAVEKLFTLKGGLYDTWFKKR